MMKALIASVAAVAALSAAMPAAAQSWGRNSDFGDFGRGRSESARLEQRIEVGLRSGQLTFREAAMLRRDVARVRDLEWRYGRDGRISANEARDLDWRYAAVSQRLRFEQRDPDRGYGAGYGYGQGGYGGGYANGYRR